MTLAKDFTVSWSQTQHAAVELVLGSNSTTTFDDENEPTSTTDADEEEAVSPATPDKTDDTITHAENDSPTTETGEVSAASPNEADDTNNHA